jgi:dolichyl-phosphate-mannose--protein O-mannosyl transferase
MLYMFQAVFPPIIRSSKCTYSIWYLSSLLAATASVGELALEYINDALYHERHIPLALFQNILFSYSTSLRFLQADMSEKSRKT